MTSLSGSRVVAFQVAYQQAVVQRHLLGDRQVDHMTIARCHLDRLLLAQKRRQAIRDGKSGEDVAEITDAERPALLKAVYSRSDIKKPRNMIGLAKDLPPEQMKALLVDSIAVPDDAMRELALARGVAVRDYLASQQLPLERLFLGAPRTDGQDKDWTPRAQLSLSTQ